MENNNKNFFYPPGGILIWILIILEIVTFGVGIIAFSWESLSDPELFRTSQTKLNHTLGFINTVVLITSGLFVAEAVRSLKSGNNYKSENLMWVTFGLGIGFVVLKCIEYREKVIFGYDLTYNAFYTFYWLLTGFHLLHVVTGLTMLLVINLKIKKSVYHKDHCLDVETGAAFWHLCDLIWLLLFPVLYLV